MATQSHQLPVPATQPGTASIILPSQAILGLGLALTPCHPGPSLCLGLGALVLAWSDRPEATGPFPLRSRGVQWHDGPPTTEEDQGFHSPHAGPKACRGMLFPLDPWRTTGARRQPRSHSEPRPSQSWSCFPAVTTFPGLSVHTKLLLGNGHSGPPLEPIFSAVLSLIPQTP